MTKRLASGLMMATLWLPLAACSGLLSSNKPPLQTYWLEPLPATAGATRDGPSLDVQLRVVPGLDTHLILTLAPDARLNHYAGAVWADTLPELLSSLLARSLRAAGPFARVSAERTRRSGACQLELETQAFFARLDHAGQTSAVEIRLDGQYRCADRQRALSLVASVPVRQQQMESIVAAFQQGLDDVTRSLLAELAVTP